MQLGTLDIICLVGYMAGIGLMGISFAKRNVTTEDYFVGGRSHKGWVIGLSLVGTSISSISFLAFPGDAFKTAYLRMVPNFMLPVALVIAAYVFLPFFRKNYISSAYEYLEMRFGPGVRVYGALAFVAAQLVRISTILFLVSIMLHTLTDLGTVPCIVISGMLVGFYTIVGGIHAVIWTDVVQTVVLAVGGAVCLLVVVSELPGGFREIIDVANGANKFSFAEYDADAGALKPVSWDLTLQRKTATMMLLIGLTIWLTEYSCVQHTIQRYAAARTDKDARQAMAVAGLTSLPIWLFFMFIGTSFYAFYQAFPTQETADMLSGARPAEDVMPYFILHQLPSGLKGIVIAAALAAAMSSIDSSINAISAVSILDVYQRHLVKGRNDRHYLVAAHLISVVVSVLMILGAIWFTTINIKTLQDTSTVLTAVLGGGLFGLFMLGMLTTRGNGFAAMCGIACTLLFISWTLAAHNGIAPEIPALRQSPDSSAIAQHATAAVNHVLDFLRYIVGADLYYTSIVGNLVMFSVGYVAGLLILHNKKKLPNLTIWTHENESHDETIPATVDG
ncbi:MAG: sodium/solute symporter [Planctomycetales bacterium]|nr:sodium/solute symporter [Planctomycetales bacterium]